MEELEAELVARDEELAAVAAKLAGLEKQLGQVDGLHQKASAVGWVGWVSAVGG